MNRLTIWLGALSGAFIAVSLVIGLQVNNLNRQASRLSSQLAQEQQAAVRSQVRLEGELAAERAAFAQAEARIGGTHRDLITCADWQSLVLPVTGFDSFNGQISASGGPPSLPQHCVNQ